jgi:hypothetical protein
MKIYIIENSNPQPNGTMFWYDKKYSLQRKSCEHYIQNSLEINKGENVVKTPPYGESIIH